VFESVIDTTMTKTTQVVEAASKKVRDVASATIKAAQDRAITTFETAKYVANTATEKAQEMANAATKYTETIVEGAEWHKEQLTQLAYDLKETISWYVEFGQDIKKLYEGEAKGYYRRAFKLALKSQTILCYITWQYKKLSSWMTDKAFQYIGLDHDEKKRKRKKWDKLIHRVCKATIGWKKLKATVFRTRRRFVEALSKKGEALSKKVEFGKTTASSLVRKVSSHL
jgi:hypothetical protein